MGRHGSSLLLGGRVDIWNMDKLKHMIPKRMKEISSHPRKRDAGHSLSPIHGGISPMFTGYFVLTGHSQVRPRVLY